MFPLAYSEAVVSGHKFCDHILEISDPQINL
jgi:hypothetical protein